MSDPPAASADLREYYARRVPEYDRIYERPERQADLRQLAPWVAQQVSGRSVLEVACGTGYWTRVLGAVARRVLATDVDAAALGAARRRVASGNVWFARLDAFGPALRGRTFDAGFAGFWWSHVPRGRLAGFLRSFHAALAPGASATFIDNRFVSGNSTPIAGTDGAGNTYQIRTLADGTRYRILKNFPTPDEVRSALAGVARDVRVVEWSYYWGVSYQVA